MAKTKGVEKKSALLQQHIKGELQKEYENDLIELEQESTKRQKPKYVRESFHSGSYNCRSG